MTEAKNTANIARIENRFDMTNSLKLATQNNGRAIKSRRAGASLSRLRDGFKDIAVQTCDLGATHFGAAFQPDQLDGMSWAMTILPKCLLLA